MPDGTVTPLRPRTRRPLYTDTAALNDIHTLLTATEPGQATLEDIALDPGPDRPADDPRPATSRSPPPRPPWAGPSPASDAGDTNVYVRQAPSRRGPADRDLHRDRRRGSALTVTLDGALLRPAGPADGEPA